MMAGRETLPAHEGQRGRSCSDNGPERADEGNDVDVLIVGAGPAGLTAAYYLARYRRKVLVLHDGRSRAQRAPMAFNVPGFPDGIAGADLLARLERQARDYDVRIEQEEVVDLSGDGQGAPYLLTTATGVRYRARGVILATGVTTHEIGVAGGAHDRAVASGVLRYCPICDGYEHRDRAIAVVGSDLHGAAEAMFLRQYSDRVTLIALERSDLDASQRAELAASDVEIVDAGLDGLDYLGTTMRVHFSGGHASRDFDIVYPALGTSPRSELAERLGLDISEDGCLPETAHAEPLRPGLYGAGDVLVGLDQISTAAGQAALAATRLHNWLRAREGHVMRQAN